jgi:hypothetical protein
MGVYIKEANKRWPMQSGHSDRIVPYKVNSADKGFVDRAITKFNNLFHREIFVPQTEENIYIIIQICNGGKCSIGCMQKPGQLLKSTPNVATLFHEMVHCIGLGLENYHPGWPSRKELLAG